MTNVTLSINDEVYKRMRVYSEIKWSEVIRKMIKQKLRELEVIKQHPDKESILTMLASEEVLKEDWDNELDDRWNDV